MNTKKMDLDISNLIKIDPGYQLLLYDIDKVLNKPFLIKGEKIYHPVNLCQKVIVNGLLYVNSSKEEYRKRALEYFNELFSGVQTDSRGNFLFPYWFPFKFIQWLNPPWYSGMAQGQVLSAISVMYIIEKNEEYKNLARKIYPTLLYMKDSNTPWVSLIDKDGYFWIEEYPANEPSHVLNGFVYSLLGVYDALSYLNLDSKDNEVLLNILSAGLRTIRDNFLFFVNRKGYSYYSIGKKVFSWYYHKIHTTQSWILFLISKDEKFLNYFNLLRGATGIPDIKTFFKDAVKNSIRKVSQIMRKMRTRCK